jgi:hypothetical protein
LIRRLPVTMNISLMPELEQFVQAKGIRECGVKRLAAEREDTGVRG